MRSASASLGCMSLALPLVVVGSPGSHWFESVGAWLVYGLWGAAVVLALIGLGLPPSARACTFRHGSSPPGSQA